MRTALLLGALCLALPAAAQARDIYVDNQLGEDFRQGNAPGILGRSGGPVRTIGRALQIASGGDQINVANTGEPYRECVTLFGGRNSGISGVRDFVIEGNGAVLDGTAPVPYLEWLPAGGDVLRFQPDRMAHQLLYLGGVPAPFQPLPVDGSLPDLQPLEWTLSRGNIYFRVEPGRLPEDYPLAHTKERVGITLYRVDRVTIRNLVIQGYQLDGVNAHDNAFNVTLSGLTCRGNARSGISVGGASNVRIDTCLVGNNGAAQVRTEGYSTTRIVNCDLIGNTAPPLLQQGGRVEVTPPPQPAAEGAPET